MAVFSIVTVGVPRTGACQLRTVVNGPGFAVVAHIPRKECLPPNFDKGGGALGNRAIVSDDGSASVIQCGDGSVLGWKAGVTALQKLGTPSLFGAAQMQGILPSGLKCVWPAAIRASMALKADCDVLDQTDDRSTFLLQSTPGDAFIATADGETHSLPASEDIAVLMPRSGRASSVIAANSQVEPGKLQRVSLPAGETITLAKLPFRNLIVENGEGGASRIVYAAKNDLLVVSYSGFFRVAEDMEYLTAYTATGTRKWEVRHDLPARTGDELIVGDETTFFLCGDGEYGVLGRTSRPHQAQIIDLKDGSEIGDLPGWPIATSRSAKTILLRDPLDDLVLVDLKASAKPPSGAASQTSYP